MNGLLTTSKSYYESKVTYREMQPYDYSDGVRMPDSPDCNVKPAPVSTSASMASSVTNHKMTNVQGMNGTHSPHTTSSTETPSPPATSQPNMSTNSIPTAELPLGCTIRQLGKLKRFLTTLQQFGSDISPDVGERVHNLILGLVSSSLTIEEFHQKVQDVTNYPLRPFVVPFLKSHLPLLQTELIHFARLAKQTPQQYLRQHEQLVIDSTLHNGGEPFEIFQADTKENGKRRTPPDTRSRENGYSDSGGDGPPPAKRHQPLPSPTLGSRMSPAAGPNHGPVGMSFRFDDPSVVYRERERDRYERYERYEREFYRPYYGTLHRDYNEERDMEDEWKNIHTMLNCILGMVEKTKRALAILQHRSQTERQDYISWGRRHLDGMDFDIKKRTSDIMAQYKTAEERVCEVRRRAAAETMMKLPLIQRQPPLLAPPEEAVNEVKRQAVAEFQKAVSVAETKASELVAVERAKMERLLSEARRQAAEEALAAINQQEDSTETCWNCGRKANETCSGCNVARYCGAFCQHKDWENHHRVCGQSANLNVGTTSVTQATTGGTSAITQVTGSTVLKRSPSPTRTGSIDIKPTPENKH
ncbi:LOW QUALITY PROTEIN: protein CBFA2T1-like [Centruroides vittatus]|uniref:LOW QUALITY PROTEIN: protein CBFA2T1-like n=1 Tax=Centruroides vittatus TaxID=120091 RepID=UPI003510AE2B